MWPAREAGYTTRFLTLPDGLGVQTIERGPADGPPVVLVHGWAGSAYSFRYTMPALAEAGYRAIAIELAGHGLTDKPDDVARYTCDVMHASVVATLDLLEIERAAFVGHSMGGALSIQTALRTPERVSRLVLLGSAWLGPVSVRKVAMLLTPAWVTPVLPRLVPRWVAKHILWGAYGRRKSFGERDVDEYWAPSQYPGYAKALRHLLHAFRWALLSPAECAALRLPVLVMFGTRDRVILTTHVERLVRAMPDARLERLPDIGHVVAEEAPARVNAAVMGFLAESAASGAATS